MHEHSFFDHNTYYLVGIKGVAMTSLAQCLRDMGKIVRGSDVPEDFVTHTLLSRLKISIDSGFGVENLRSVDCVIYTSAHKGPDNPQVLEARAKEIPTYSQAEAIAFLANEKKGIAVCGVGGKSTVSAMITWILDKTGHNPSFSIGVGNIPGLEKTGSWSTESEYFVVEADEYVIDPHANEKGLEIVPRFSFLKPFVTVCTNLAFDHPDVYRDFSHTKQEYNKFFSQLKPGGTYVYNELNQSDLPELVVTRGTSFGESTTADLQYIYHAAESTEGRTVANIMFKGQQYNLELKIPGKYNVANAAAALAAVVAIGIDIQAAINTLTGFRSTMRRFELLGDKNGVTYYDDYAHHPSEVKAAIQALTDWYPENRKVICFQSHTYSRTKQLFNDFVEALATADKVLLIDIFASAREAADPTITSDMLVDEIQKIKPRIQIKNVKTIENLSRELSDTTGAGDVVLTLGAGDIYKVHELILND